MYCERNPHVITIENSDYIDINNVGDWRILARETLIERGITGTVTEMIVSRSNFPNHILHRSKKKFQLAEVSNPSLDDEETVKLTEKLHNVTLVKVVTESIYAIPAHSDVDESIHQISNGTLLGDEIGGSRKVLRVSRIHHR